MAKSANGSTRGGEVLKQMRLDILAGEFKPGERLKFPLLTERYGVSAGLLKEALSNLVDMGFATMQPHLGYTVVPLSAEGLGELTQARLAIEPMVFGMAVERATVEWESQILAAHHVLEHTQLDTAPHRHTVGDEWASAHAHFHATLLLSCGNSRLMNFAVKLRDEAELYRRWSVSLPSSMDRDLDAEHRGLMEAALNHHPEQAVHRLAEHISLTTSILVREMNEATL